MTIALQNTVILTVPDRNCAWALSHSQKQRQTRNVYGLELTCLQKYEKGGRSDYAMRAPSWTIVRTMKRHDGAASHKALTDEYSSYDIIAAIRRSEKSKQTSNPAVANMRVSLSQPHLEEAHRGSPTRCPFAAIYRPAVHYECLSDVGVHVESDHPCREMWRRQCPCPHSQLQQLWELAFNMKATGREPDSLSCCLTNDPAVAQLLETKECEAEQTRAALRAIRPIRTQLKAAIESRDKLMKKHTCRRRWSSELGGPVASEADGVG